MPKALQLVGQRFGMWTVIARAGCDRHFKAMWKCRCDCGKVHDVESRNLTQGKSTSCGCTRQHGKTSVPEYGPWRWLKQRCLNKQNKAYHNYGGRGIKVCARWRKSFLAFRADVGCRPSRHHSLERIDNDGNYEPGNVRWATVKEQARNTRRTKLTLSVVQHIRDWYAEGEHTQKEIGLAYGVSQSLVGQIVRGHIWV
jgi:hypothetical protein